MASLTFMDYCFEKMTEVVKKKELNFYDTFVLGYTSGKYGGITFDKVRISITLDLRTTIEIYQNSANDKAK